MSIYEDVSLDAITDVEDGMVTGLGELINSSEQIVELSRDIAKGVDIHESVESFNHRFMELVSADGWDERTSVQYRVGIASVLRAHGYSVPVDEVSTSFEEVGTSQTSDENRAESNTKTKNLLVRIYEALKAALIKLRDSVKRFFMRLKNNADAVKKAGNSLSEAASKMTKDAAENHSIALKPEWSYYYRGAAEGSDPSVIPGACATAVQKLLGHWDSSFKDAVFEVANNKLPESGKDVHAEFDLPGGLEVYVSGLNKDFVGSGVGLLKAEVKVFKGKPVDSIPVLTKAQIGKLGKELIAVAGMMGAMSEKSEPFITAANRVVEQQKSKADGMTPAAVTQAKKLMSTYPLAGSVLLPYVALTALNAWKHAEMSIKLIARHNDAADKASKKTDGANAPKKASSTAKITTDLPDELKSAIRRYKEATAFTRSPYGARREFAHLAGSAKENHSAAQLAKWLQQLEAAIPDLWDGKATSVDAGYDWSGLNNEKASWSQERIRTFALTLTDSFTKKRWNKLKEIIQHVRG